MDGVIANDEGTRFKFGKNWLGFSTTVNDERQLEARKSLCHNLKIEHLKSKTFLDIGSGSGLFSLAAHQLGAAVTSFDFDQDSVNCTSYLKNQYASNALNWTVAQGSVLDNDYLASLGQFDIVYSWGVLHHTGDMYQAFSNVIPLVKKGGQLFISIYNDQGNTSKRWTSIKKFYNKTNTIFKSIIFLGMLVRLWSISMIKDLFKHGNPLKSWNLYKKNRGMSAYHDIIDWIGGYPFEVAKPEDVFTFFTERGFQLCRLKTCGGGIGCNEYVFNKLKS